MKRKTPITNSDNKKAKLFYKVVLNDGQKVEIDCFRQDEPAAEVRARIADLYPDTSARNVDGPYRKDKRESPKVGRMLPSEIIKIEISKDKPIPQRINRTIAWHTVLKKMEIGDSILLNNVEATNVRHYTQRLKIYVQIEPADDEKEGHYRAWRIEKPTSRRGRVGSHPSAHPGSRQ